MSKKKGWRELAQEVFGFGQKKDEKSFERTLHEAGVSVVSDRKLEERIKLLMQFEESVTEPITTDNLQDYLGQLRTKTDLMNHAIYRIAAPYARAGTYPVFGRMLLGWSKIYASSKSWILRTEDVIGKDKKKPDNKNNGETEKTEAEKKDKDENETSGVLDEGAAQELHVELVDVHGDIDQRVIGSHIERDIDVELAARLAKGRFAAAASAIQGECS